MKITLKSRPWILKNTEDDILQLEKELEKQRIISEGLIKTKDSNSQKLKVLASQHDKFSSEMEALNLNHN